jgi:hypothetical protein
MLNGCEWGNRQDQAHTALCRTLERELTAAKAECEELLSVNATGAERLRFVLEENSRLRAEVERYKDDYRDAGKQITERLWKEFITLMEITEESDSGNEFRPNKISSCRAMDGKRLNEILAEARRIVF